MSVSRNLSDHVINATDTIDQNINNIKTISAILMESATLLSDNVTFKFISFRSDYGKILYNMQ